MRFFLAPLFGCACIVAASTASAETRIFIVANQFGQCLARDVKCNTDAAHSYCRSRNFAQASTYRRVDPEEITGEIPKSGKNCSHDHCDEYVAIFCQR